MKHTVLLAAIVLITLALIPLMAQEKAPEHLARVATDWETDWSKHSVPLSELMAGGPPRDGIPPIDTPKFISVEAANEWLNDREPVLVYEHNGDARAYPLQILTFHEIVNDTVGGKKVVISYCPLCNSAMVFDRMLDGKEFTFGTSGLLRKSDLVMWDRQTESLWQQVSGKAIVGEMTGTTLPYLVSNLTSYKKFADAYPEGRVLSKETDHNRPYGRNPYAGYDTPGKKPFLYKDTVDERLDAMARVVTFELDGKAFAIAHDALKETGVTSGATENKSYVVFYKEGQASAMDAAVIAEARDVGSTGVYVPEIDGTHLTFERKGDHFVDAETSTTWNIFGKAIAGKHEGAELKQIPSGDHFWFAWAAFKPETKVIK